jgi:DNA polymerase-3 subunit beta
VSFLSTDTEVQITHAEIGSGADVTGTTVAARKLLDILRALPESGDVTMTLLTSVTVQSGKSASRCKLAAEEFPTVQQADSFNACQPAAENPEAPVQHGAFLHGAAGHPLLPERPVAGGRWQQRDRRGHRRPPPGVCQVATEQTFARQEVIIRARPSSNCSACWKTTTSRATGHRRQPGQADLADIELISKLVEGKFPDYTA